MKIPILFLPTILLLSVVPVIGNSHKEKAESYLELMGIKEDLAKTYSEIQGFIIPKRDYILETAETEEEKKKIEEEFTQHLNKMKALTSWEANKEAYIKLCTDTYTERELDLLLEFFGTEEGQRIKNKERDFQIKFMAHSEETIVAEQKHFFIYLDRKLKEAFSK